MYPVIPPGMPLLGAPPVDDDEDFEEIIDGKRVLSKKRSREDENFEYSNGPPNFGVEDALSANIRELYWWSDLGSGPPLPNSSIPHGVWRNMHVHTHAHARAAHLVRFAKPHAHTKVVFSILPLTLRGTVRFVVLGSRPKWLHSSCRLTYLSVTFVCALASAPFVPQAD